MRPHARADAATVGRAGVAVKTAVSAVERHGSAVEVERGVVERDARAVGVAVVVAGGVVAHRAGVHVERAVPRGLGMRRPAQHGIACRAKVDGPGPVLADAGGGAPLYHAAVQVQLHVGRHGTDLHVDGAAAVATVRALHVLQRHALPDGKDAPVVLHEAAGRAETDIAVSHALAGRGNEIGGGVLAGFLPHGAAVDDEVAARLLHCVVDAHGGAVRLHRAGGSRRAVAEDEGAARLHAEQRRVAGALFRQRDGLAGGNGNVHRPAARHLRLRAGVMPRLRLRAVAGVEHDIGDARRAHGARQLRVAGHRDGGVGLRPGRVRPRHRLRAVSKAVQRAAFVRFVRRHFGLRLRVAGEEVRQKRRAARGRHGHAAAQQRHAHGSRRHEPAGASPREHAPPPFARAGVLPVLPGAFAPLPYRAVAPPIGKAPSMSTPPPMGIFRCRIRPARHSAPRGMPHAARPAFRRLHAPRARRRAARRTPCESPFRRSRGQRRRCSRDSPSSSSRRSDSQ